MGKRICPLCGAKDRSHEVKLEMREVGGSSKGGTGIHVCGVCATALTGEVTALFAAAREGRSPGLDIELIQELDEERDCASRLRDDMARIGE